MRVLLFALALLTSTVATAQTESVVVTFTPDGYGLATVSDQPLEDDRAILLTHTETGEWFSRMLERGDVPSEVPTLRLPARFRPVSASQMIEARMDRRPASRSNPEARVGRRMDEFLSDGMIDARRQSRPSSRVRYTVWFSRLPAAAVPTLLTDLEAEAPFTEAEVQSSDETAEVQLSFSFSSVEAWTEWTEQTDLEERFAQDPSVLVRTTVNVSRSVRRVLEDVMDRMDIGDGEIIDDMFEGDVIGDGEIIDDID